MPRKKKTVLEGESSISKEKPISDTFAAIPDPDELDAVMLEIEAEAASETTGLESSDPIDKVDETDKLIEDTNISESETLAEADGQIDFSPAPILEIENSPLADSDFEEGESLQDTADTPMSDEDSDINIPEQLTIPIDEPEAEPQKKKDERYDPKKPRKIDSVFEFVELIIFTFLAVMIVSSFFFRHAEVIGTSMENTLDGGDHLIISDFFYTPAYGDIIVCSDYSTGLKNPIVKRVIGIAGDVIKIDEDGNVIRNGKVLDEPYVYINSAFSAYVPDEWVVPDGEVFVMGDHRNVSEDSRSFGTVKVDSILGKVLLRFYPFEKFGTVE